MIISVTLLTGKKLESSKKIKEEPLVEPAFKVHVNIYTLISLAVCFSCE